ncbi:unnamed protein product [Linum trigynum]|uniref:Uncharacterized protein n=1 Tax=Linum trigynum TaxID=586398 RepID=A0AAV2FNJ4_9ROSI
MSRRPIHFDSASVWGLLGLEGAIRLCFLAAATEDDVRWWWNRLRRLREKVVLTERQVERSFNFHALILLLGWNGEAGSWRVVCLLNANGEASMAGEIELENGQLREGRNGMLRGNGILMKRTRMDMGLCREWEGS